MCADDCWETGVRNEDSDSLLERKGAVLGIPRDISAVSARTSVPEQECHVECQQIPSDQRGTKSPTRIQGRFKETMNNSLINT